MVCGNCGASPAISRFRLEQLSKRIEKHSLNILFDLPRRGGDGSVQQGVHEGNECSVSLLFEDVYSPDVAFITVEFDGGRAAPTGFHGGWVNVTCGGESYHIPWGVVINR